VFFVRQILAQQHQEVLSRVGQSRTSYIYTVNNCIFGDLPAKKLYIHRMCMVLANPIGEASLCLLGRHLTYVACHEEPTYGGGNKSQLEIV